MRRRQRRDPIESSVGGIVGLVGLIFAACIFVPGVRVLFARMLVVSLIGIGVTLVVLVVWAVYRHNRQHRESDYVATYLGGKPVSSNGPDAAPEVHSGLSHVVGNGSASQAISATFSRELLDALEWRRFEELVTWYFQKMGQNARRSRVGADGGVDILLSKPANAEPFAYVQCKAWHVYKVGIKAVRELYGVMASDKIQQGYFITTGEFTEEALRFAQGKEMILLSGGDLLSKINALPESERSEMLKLVTAGDYSTPTCPRCDVKMVRRTGSDGDFWGCVNYSKRPSCRQTFKLREVERSAADWCL